MILNISGRTDIPAFYSQWLVNRFKAGYLYVRNPYYPTEIIHIDLDPKTIDLIVLTTKNPRPLLKDLAIFDPFHVCFHITVTPYDQDIERKVPNVKEVVKDIKKLSKYFGKERIVLRYDPIIITEKYSVDYHIYCFEKLLQALQNDISECIISFVDLYAKSKILDEVKIEDRINIVQAFSKMGRQYHVRIKTCAEVSYEQYGIEKSGCLNKESVERLIGTNIIEQSHIPARIHCGCIASRDVGEYDTCLHECLYCYATDHQLAKQKYLQHDIHSPLLIGHVSKEDRIKKIQQKSLVDPQLALFWGEL